MRLVAWNCNMALHRKAGALMSLRPDVAVISECAAPERLMPRLPPQALPGLSHDPVWLGGNPNKGLAVFAFNGYRLSPLRGYDRSLRFIAPVRVRGPLEFNLLAVWAQNANDGIWRKNEAGPLSRALDRYRSFLRRGPALIAGDFNNNVFWDKPGWAMNHKTAVTSLARRGMVSAYHTVRQEPQGAESQPTLYWRDRRKDGPTYHIDYIFLPKAWAGRIAALTVGRFEDWCGSGLSDHVPLTLQIGNPPK